MSAVSPQRILEEAIDLLETLAPGKNDEVLDERIDNNLLELRDLIKKLYMAGIYNI